MKLGRWWLLLVAVMVSCGWQFTHAQSNAQYLQMQRQMEMQRQQDQMRRQQEQMRRQQEQMQRQQAEMRRRQQEVMQRQQEEMHRRQQETMARQQNEVRRRQQQEAMTRQQVERQRQFEQQRNAGAVQRQLPGQRAMPGSSQANGQTRSGVQRGLKAANNNAQVANSNRNVKLTRPLTPSEIRRGFTGRTTADGKAFVRYRGGVVLVPASRVAGLVAKPAANTSGASRALPSGGGGGHNATALAAKARLAFGGAGKPPGGPRAANDNVESRIAYQKFFRQSKLPLSAYFTHRNGVDFSKPAQVRRLVADPKKPVILCQYQAPGRPTGDYFGPCGQTPTSMGISPRGNLSGSKTVATTKYVRKYVVVKDMDVFESVAKKGVIDDWSVKGEKFRTEGGGTQYFFAHKDWQKYLKQVE